MNRTTLQEMEEIKEEAVYVNAAECTVDKRAAPPDQRFLFFTRSFLPIAVCWLILLAIMGARIHFTAKLTADNQNLTAQNQELNSQNQELNSGNQELNSQNQELNSQNQELNSQNQELNSRNQELNSRNQELEIGKYLTEKIQDMETNWNNLNVSRAQWSIDTYLRKPR